MTPMTKRQRADVARIERVIERQQRRDRVHRVRYGTPSPEQARKLAAVMGPGLRQIAR